MTHNNHCGNHCSDYFILLLFIKGSTSGLQQNNQFQNVTYNDYKMSDCKVRMSLMFFSYVDFNT